MPPAALKSAIGSTAALKSAIGSKSTSRGEFGFLITCTSGSNNDRHVESVYLQPKITTGCLFAEETHVIQAKRSVQQPGTQVELQPNESTPQEKQHT